MKSFFFRFLSYDYWKYMVLLSLFFCSKGWSDPCFQYSLLGKLWIKDRHLVLITDPETSNQKIWPLAQSVAFHLLPFHGKWVQGEFLVHQYSDPRRDQIEVDKGVHAVPFLTSLQKGSHVQSLGLKKCEQFQGKE